MQGLSSVYGFFATSNAGARMIDSIYHIIWHLSYFAVITECF